MRSIRPAAVFALVVVLATACAGGAGEADPTATPGATSPPPATAASGTPTGAAPGATGPALGAPGPPAPTGRPSGPLVPVPTAPRGAEQTLTGEVVAGVEDGCKLLSTGGGDYLLFGSLSRDLRYGDTVTVRGRLRPDIASTCQQGTPFEVTEVLD